MARRAVARPGVGHSSLRHAFLSACECRLDQNIQHALGRSADFEQGPRTFTNAIRIVAIGGVMREGQSQLKTSWATRFRRYELPLLSGLLLLSVLLVFGKTLRNDFVNYDDPDYVTENLRVQ